MRSALLNDTLTITPPGGSPLTLPGRVDSAKQGGLYSATAQTPGAEKMTHLAYLNGDVKVSMGTQVDSLTLSTSFYVLSPSKGALGRSVIDHTEIELREIGRFNDADSVVIFRPNVGTDAEGNPVGGLTQVWTGPGQFASSATAPSAAGDVRTEMLDAFVRLPKAALVRIGYLVDVRAHRWTVRGVVDALDHTRIDIRRVD